MSHFPLPEHDFETVLEPNKRYFGEFKCGNCARKWKSANSWFGSGQDCLVCGELTFPVKLSQYIPSSCKKDIHEKRHPQGKCQRCNTLGYDCGDSEGVELGPKPTSGSRDLIQKFGIGKVMFVAAIGLTYCYLKQR